VSSRRCVIFNPTARGDKARKFRAQLDKIAAESTLKQTTKPGEARKLAAQAVEEGFETIVAAGGDGTINEVLNGIGDAPDGFEKSRLGVLPLGTVNVFAREMAIPADLSSAWSIILAGKETRIDLPQVEYAANGGRECRYFAQLAGAGLDARAIELVKWQIKKAVGPLAYVLAGMHALLGPPARIKAAGDKDLCEGALVLIGNGRLYGGQFRLFPDANLNDGALDVCVLPKCDWMTLARCSPGLLLNGGLPASATKNFQAEKLTLTSPENSPVQIDGEFVGHLPATFTLQRSRLRVVVP
jgi:diacylglycerol kinase (ATP)